MKIDLAKIDAQIKRLEEVRRIAADPDLLALLETVVVNGANGSAAQMTINGLTPVIADPLSKLKEGSLVRAVGEFARKMEGQFTAYELADAMANGGYRFNPGGRTKPGVIVADIVRTVLVSKGIARIYKKGVGSEPTIYIKV